MITASEKPRFLNIQDTATRLGKSSQVVAMWIEEGRLPVLNIAPEPKLTRAAYRIPDGVAVNSGPWSPAAFSLPWPPPLGTCQPLLPVKAVAEMFSCSLENVAHLIQAGRLEAFDLSSRGGKVRRALYRMSVPAVNRFVAANLTP